MGSVFFHVEAERISRYVATELLIGRELVLFFGTRNSAPPNAWIGFGSEPPLEVTLVQALRKSGSGKPRRTPAVSGYNKHVRLVRVV